MAMLLHGLETNDSRSKPEIAALTNVITYDAKGSNAMLEKLRASIIPTNQLRLFSEYQINEYIEGQEASKQKIRLELAALLKKHADYLDVLKRVELTEIHAQTQLEIRRMEKEENDVYNKLYPGQVEKILQLRLLHIRAGLLAYEMNLKTDDTENLVKEIRNMFSK